MFVIIGIVASVILGAFVGRIACNLMNKNQFTVNPLICTLVGIIGGGLGGWLMGNVGINGGLKLVLLQLVAGVALTGILMIFVLFARDKKEDMDEDMEDDEEEEDESK